MKTVPVVRTDRCLGYLPESFEEDEESEFRRRRRYFRKKPVRRKLKRWRQGD